MNFPVTIILLLSIFSGLTKAINVLNLFTTPDNLLTINTILYILEKFDEYSEQNHLDIHLNRYIFLTDYTNYTDEVGEYFKKIDLKTESTSSKYYNMFVVDDSMLLNHRDHFMDLYEVLPKEHIEMFNQNILPIVDNKLYGLPLYVFFPVLYYNKELLDTYKVNVPSTWDELLEGAQYIINEERKKNGNSNLIGYDGHFHDSEIGTMSYYDFIYSFRDNKDSKYIEFNNTYTKDALIKLKEITEKIPSDGKYDEKRFIFFRNLYFPFSNQTTPYSILPGVRPGISGAITRHLNIAINKNISKKKKEIAIKVLKYLTSKEAQKKFMIDFSKEKDRENKYMLLSAITSLYNDTEICEIVDCDIIKNSQLTIRPWFNQNEYFEWSEKFRKNINQYLHERKPLSETLNEINCTELYSSYSSGNKLFKQSFFEILLFFFSYLIIHLIFM